MDLLVVVMTVVLAPFKHLEFEANTVVIYIRCACIWPNLRSV